MLVSRSTPPGSRQHSTTVEVTGTSGGTADYYQFHGRHDDLPGYQTTFTDRDGRDGFGRGSDPGGEYRGIESGRVQSNRRLRQLHAPTVRSRGGEFRNSRAISHPRYGGLQFANIYTAEVVSIAVLMPVIALLALAPKSAADRLVRGLFDDTFRRHPSAGLVRLGHADSLLHGPGHPVGLRHSPLRHHPHLFQAPQEAPPASRPSASSSLPPVTIQLPLYNERYVVERLIEEVVKIEYPQGTAADPGAGRFHRRYGAVCRSAGGALPEHGLPDRVPPPHQPPRIQGGRAAGRAENGHRANWWPCSTPISARRPIS